jgi:hypothetical protein
MSVSVLFLFYLITFLANFIRATASDTVKKVIEINPYLLGTMAGGAGACIHLCIAPVR